MGVEKDWSYTLESFLRVTKGVRNVVRMTTTERDLIQEMKGNKAFSDSSGAHQFKIGYVKGDTQMPIYINLEQLDFLGKKFVRYSVENSHYIDLYVVKDFLSKNYEGAKMTNYYGLMSLIWQPCCIRLTYT